MSYTPEADFFGTDTFTYTISDGNGGTDTATVTVTVTNVNDDPIANDDTATVAEDASATRSTSWPTTRRPRRGETLTVTAVSTRANGTVAITGGGTGLTYTPDADFFGTDTFTYTISDGNGGTATATVTVTVTNVNDAPVLAPIADDTIPEMVPFGFTASASDIDGDDLTFSLDGEPSGASIDPLTGEFSWTPGEAQGPGVYTFDVVVTDDGTPALDDTEEVTLTVLEVNRAPTVDPIADDTIDEMVAYTFTATATDPDLPANGLTFSLDGDAVRRRIDPLTGVFSWTPGEAQGPGVYTFDVVVTDDGTPALTTPRRSP